MKTPYSQLFSEELPIAKAIIFEPLLKKYKKLSYMQSCISHLSILGLGLLIYWFWDAAQIWMLYGFLLIWSLFFSYNLAAIHFGFPNKGFAIRIQDMHYRTGWLTSKIITVPFCRIQHMQISQGMLAKALGLAKLKIYTAGDSSNDMVIKGISFSKAQEIKAFLSEEIKKNGTDRL